MKMPLMMQLRSSCCLLVETSDGGFQRREIGSFGRVLHPAALHHLNDGFVTHFLVDSGPESWFLPVFHVLDNLCKYKTPVCKQQNVFLKKRKRSKFIDRPS